MPHLRAIRDRLSDRGIGFQTCDEAATVIVLADEPLAREGQLEELAHWLTPATPQKAKSMRAPLRAMLSLASADSCQTIVIEHDYVCLDWQSEHERFWGTRHEGRAPEVPRLHFFAGKLATFDLWALTGKEEYLGYSVVRPVPMGPVGRTLLRTPEWLSNATLCTVTERPTLFGTPYTVTGVPFMQQDAELMSCAHAAIWQAHYVAASRGLTARRYTAEIVDLTVPVGRQRASEGLTLEQMRATFAGLGLPTILLQVADLASLPAPLPESLLGTWQGLRDAVADARAQGMLPECLVEHLDECVKLEDDKEALSPGELREQMLRSLCRSVNSGIPAIVSVDTDSSGDHAINVVGWVRRGNLPKERLSARADLTDDDVVLVVYDDQSMAYELVEDPLLDGRGPWHALVIPAIDRIELSGEGAEERAFSHLKTSAQAVLKAAEEGEQADQGDIDLAALRPGVATLRGDVSVRVQLIEGRVLKAVMSAQGRGSQAASIYRMARLPKWVWVAELQDRKLRADNEPCVLAEIVFDTTSPDEVPITLLTATLNTTKDATRLRADRSEAKASGPGEPWHTLRTITGGRPGLPQAQPGLPAQAAA